MNIRQTLAGAVVIALVCCLVMWMLEDFRQRKMIADFRSMLDQLPTFSPPTSGLPEP